VVPRPCRDSSSRRAVSESSSARNARENDELLRRATRGNDWWLHTRDYPGGYVFVKARSGKSIPLEVLLDAGNLALFFSKARSAGKADLYYTQVKYLRRAKDGPKGLVLPTQEKNLLVELDTERLNRLGVGLSFE
jgi:predicted ribosome quality control (RQC) complex YloA/Tae2 family protein